MLDHVVLLESPVLDRFAQILTPCSPAINDGLNEVLWEEKLSVGNRSATDPSASFGPNDSFVSLGPDESKTSKKFQGFRNATAKAGSLLSAIPKKVSRLVRDAVEKVGGSNTPSPSGSPQDSEDDGTKRFPLPTGLRSVSPTESEVGLNWLAVDGGIIGESLWTRVFHSISDLCDPKAFGTSGN